MLLSFNQLQEKKKTTKVIINPKKEDVMEKSDGLKKNHGEDCDCLKCEQKRRADDVNDGPDIANEENLNELNKGEVTKDTKYHKMSYKAFKKTHKDFKSKGEPGKTLPRVTTLDKKTQATVSRPVKFVPEGHKSCGEGQYYCHDDKKCKPIPEGYKEGKDGMLVKEGSEKSYYIDKEAEKRGMEREARKAQNKAASKERAAQKRRSERNALRRQGKYGAVGGYYVTKHMEREGVEPEVYWSSKALDQLDEIKYEVMSKKKYASTHKDFKGGTKKEPRVSVYDPEKKATVSRLVKFSEMACGGKPTPPNPKAKKQRVANVGLTSEAKLEDVMTTSTPVTKKKELMRNIKKEEAYIKNNNENIYGSQKEVSNQSDQSSKNETSILSEKDTALDIVKKNIIAKYGKGAIMRKGSNQPKKVRGAKSTVGTGKYLKRAKEKAQLKADAKEMGYGDDTKGYVETRARYGSKENMKKGKGLGT